MRTAAPSPSSRVHVAASDDEIDRCFDVMHQLRPHLGADEFRDRAKHQMASSTYRMAFLEDGGNVVAVAGYRVLDMLSRGRFLYVDDLVTDEAHRSRGHGTAMLRWLEAEARCLGCARLHLDSGTERKDAHRFYQREGLQVTALHFGAALDDETR